MGGKEMGGGSIFVQGRQYLYLPRVHGPRHTLTSSHDGIVSVFARVSLTITKEYPFRHQPLQLIPIGMAKTW